ncbi:replicative DNA helicase [Olsenella sp. HMSC062G07]|uniref:replicative DNA helicase n=1 Tax=Olsenella sp. HMSC062G07 TaxID=1739330 RepID=UPI0008A403E6|nr:replicative DNA helicase [Olsenella sp. HMSC062G07]OFK22205.1 replicative DNA helicase [Olsenella sp. HMSC062G07]
MSDQFAPYDEYDARQGAPARQGSVMPHSPAAEKSVLTAMLMMPEALQECLTSLREGDFYLYAHKLIFTAVSELFSTGKAIDVISLADHLKSQGKLDKVGGASYLIDLNQESTALVSWPHYVEMLRRDATLRDIIVASSKISSLAFDAPEDTKEVVDEAEKLLMGVTDRAVKNSYVTLSAAMEDLYEELSEACQNPDGILGVQTGYPGIDARLQGLRAGQMVVVGARPGVGKTSFALNLAVNAAAKGASVAFFSLEMSKMEIAQRLLSAQAKIPLSAIRSARIKDNQWDQIVQATYELSTFDIMIDDTPGTTVTEIRAKARRMLKGKEQGIVLVDYLQLLSPPSGRRADSRATEVSEMSRGIKIMAKDLGVPVVALSQLNRQVTDRKGQRPQLSDLRESGSIEQDADIVILLDRSMNEEEAERQDRPDLGVTDFIIAKNRSGPLDIVPLMFLPSSTKFVEVDTRHSE